MVSAFDSAQVQVSKGDHGNLEIFSYDGSPVSSEDDKFDFPIYSIFTNEDGSRDEWFKNDAKRYQNDTSINYAITGSTPEYNSYSISSDSYIIINTGEWPSAYVLPGWAIALCSIAGLIFFGVIAYFIWRCIKRRRNKATPSPVGPDRDQITESTIYEKKDPEYPDPQYTEPQYPNVPPPNQQQLYYPPPPTNVAAPQYSYPSQQPSGPIQPHEPLNPYADDKFY